MDPMADLGLSMDPTTRDRHAYAMGNPVGMVDTNGHAATSGSGNAVYTCKFYSCGNKHSKNAVVVNNTNAQGSCRCSYVRDGDRSTFTHRGKTVKTTEAGITVLSTRATAVSQVRQLWSRAQSADDPRRTGGNIVSICPNAMAAINLGLSGSVCGHVGVRVENGKNPLNWHWDAGATATGGVPFGIGPMFDAGISGGITHGTANIEDLAGTSHAVGAGASEVVGVQASYSTSNPCGERIHSVQGGPVAGLGLWGGWTGSKTAAWGIQDRCS